MQTKYDALGIKPKSFKFLASYTASTCDRYWLFGYWLTAFDKFSKLYLASRRTDEQAKVLQKASSLGLLTVGRSRLAPLKH